MTTPTEQFLHDGFEGGWKEGATFNYYEPLYKDIGWYTSTGEARRARIETIILDLSFWKAVGKVRGWHCEVHRRTPNAATGHKISDCDDSSRKQHRLIDLHNECGDWDEAFKRLEE